MLLKIYSKIKFLKISILQSLQNNMIGRQSTWQQMCRGTFVCLDVKITIANGSLSDSVWRCDANRNALFIELYSFKRDMPSFSCCHLKNKSPHTYARWLFIRFLLIFPWKAHVANYMPFLIYCNKYFFGSLPACILTNIWSIVLIPEVFISFH